jgi:hypothetical protein
MTSREFCYWLQGYFEINGTPASLSPEKVDMIRRHLALVFHHEIDPSYGGDQAQLQAIHDGKTQSPSPVKPPYAPSEEILVRC